MTAIGPPISGNLAIRFAKEGWHRTRRRTERVLVDRRLGVDTAGLIPLGRLGLEHSLRASYEPSPWRTLRLVLPPQEVTREDVFIDIGAGKGRVLIEAILHYPFRRVNGLGLSGELAAIARTNVAAQRRTALCLNQLLASLERRSRPLRLNYRTPYEQERLLATGRFRRVRQYYPIRPTVTLRNFGSVALYVVS
jgi:hypothetical protein